MKPRRDNSELINLLLRLLPKDIREPILTYRKMAVVTKSEVVLLFAVSTAAVVFEAFGAAMIFPIVEFLQANQDVDALRQKSQFWDIAVDVLGVLGMNVSLVSLSLLVFTMVVLRQIVSYARDVYVSSLKERTFRIFTMKCFDAVMGAEKYYLQDMGSGSFAFLHYGQCNSAGSIIRAVASLWTNLLTVVAYGIIMFMAAPLASLAGCVFGVVLVVSMQWLVRRARELSVQATKHGEVYSGVLVEKYRTWNLIRLSNGLPRERKHVREQAEKLYQLNLRLAENSARMQLISGPLVVGMALVALYVTIEYLDLTPAAVMVFFLVLVRLMPLVQRFTMIRQNINVINAFLQRITEVLEETKVRTEPPAGDRQLGPLSQAIDIENVSFRYESAEGHALNDVSIHIPAGKTTAITGPTGAGKSTLIDMLPRMIAPAAGRILFDGIPIEEFSLESLRAQIGFVDQSPVIINASMLENIRYARPDATFDEVREASRLAHVDEFVELLPEKYDTVLGEGGFKLSGGQRQRLALARTFLKHASILILDEPTSALDYETERKIQKTLEAMVKDRNLTLIVIAHRLATIRNADHLVVIKEGRVLEEGPPSHLRREDSWYRTILEIDDAGTAETTPQDAQAS